MTSSADTFGDPDVQRDGSPKGVSSQRGGSPAETDCNPEGTSPTGGDHLGILASDQRYSAKLWAREAAARGVEQAIAFRSFLDRWGDDVVLSRVSLMDAFDEGYGRGSETEVAKELRRLRVREEARARLEKERSGRTAGLEVTEARDLLRMPEPTWLVDGLLPSVGTFQLFGESGRGKSFVVQDLLLSVATGAAWLNSLPVRTTGSVLYVAAEGGWDLGKRVRGWMAARDGVVPERFISVIEQGLDLRSRRDVDDIIELCRDRGVVMAVFDTWALHMPGGDENSGRDAGAAIASLKRMASKVEALVGTVHHVGHGEQHRARGWSGMRAAWDAEFGFDGHTLRHTKNRYGPTHDAIGVRFEDVEGTRVARRVEPVTAALDGFLDGQAKVLEAIRERPGENWSVQRDGLGMGNTTSANLRDALADEGLIVKRNGKWWPAEDAP